ncbi:MAG TPA: hypothetical protein OIM03_00980 [Veillonellaceae bacterium]|nr:hypothetical protein [Veillonellaceae bacterium]
MREKSGRSTSPLIIAALVDTEGFDLPQRGRRLAYLLTVARERGAVFIVFYKKVFRAVARLPGFSYISFTFPFKSILSDNFFPNHYLLHYIKRQCPLQDALIRPLLGMAE